MSIIYYIYWACDEDLVKKCMEYIVKGRSPDGRPRRTWLDSVEADMAELEIYKDDVHDRNKWRRNIMKRKSNPIGKRTLNLYIYIYICQNIILIFTNSNFIIF